MMEMFKVSLCCVQNFMPLVVQVQEARQNHDDEAVKRAVNEYDEALECYIPVLMQQAKIYWDMENYQQVNTMEIRLALKYYSTA